MLYRFNMTPRLLLISGISLLLLLLLLFLLGVEIGQRMVSSDAASRAEAAVNAPSIAAQLPTAIQPSIKPTAGAATQAAMPPAAER